MEKEITYIDNIVFKTIIDEINKKIDDLVKNEKISVSTAICQVLGLEDFLERIVQLYTYLNQSANKQSDIGLISLLERRLDDTDNIILIMLNNIIKNIILHYINAIEDEKVKVSNPSVYIDLDRNRRSRSRNKNFLGCINPPKRWVIDLSDDLIRKLKEYIKKEKNKVKNSQYPNKRAHW